MVWTSSLVLAAVSLLTLNAGACVIRDEDIDAPDAALKKNAQENAFNKQWQDVLGDVENTYKKIELAPLDFGEKVSVLEQTRESKEKVDNAEFGEDEGNKTEDDKVKAADNAKEDELREKYGEEYVDKEENVLGEGVLNDENVRNEDVVQEVGIQEETPAQYMDREEDKLDEAALREEREEDDIIEERHTETDGLEGETPEEYRDKQENELYENLIKEKDEEDDIEKEERAKEDMLEKLYEENGSNSEGNIAKEIAKLYAVNDGDMELNGERMEGNEKEEETVNDKKKTNSSEDTAEGTIDDDKRDVAADVKNITTQDNAKATNENEQLSTDQEEIIEFVELMFADGVPNLSDPQNEKDQEKVKEKEAMVKLDEGSMVDGELDAKNETGNTDVKSNTTLKKDAKTSENEKFDKDQEEIIEIVEITFGAGGDKTSDQQNGKESELKEDGAEIQTGEVKTGEMINEKAKSKIDVESTTTPDKAIETSVEELVGQNGTNTTQLSSPDEAAATLKTNNDTTTSKDDDTIANVEAALILSGATGENPDSQVNVTREIREARYPVPWSKTTDEPHVNIERYSRPGWSANLVTSTEPSKQKPSLGSPPITRQWSRGPYETPDGRNLTGYIVNERVVERRYVRPSILDKPSDINYLKNLESYPVEQELFRTSDNDKSPRTPVTTRASELSQFRRDEAIDLDQNMEGQASQFCPYSVPDVDEDQQMNYINPSYLSNPPETSFPSFAPVPAFVPILYPVIPIPLPLLWPSPVPAVRPPPPQRHPQPQYFHRHQPPSCPYDNENSYLPPGW